MENPKLRARNRQHICSDPAKVTRFPRTTRRQERIEAVLRHRQPDLSVVLENVHDPHNVGAVLRSCDAVGVMHVHTVYSIEERPHAAYAQSSSSGARKWINVTHHESADACFQVLAAQGLSILAASLNDDSQTLYDLDLTRPMALVFGNENRGVSDEFLARAEVTVAIPMMGMVESLNISVACAVSLYEAMRQRQAAGMYEQSRLTETERAALGEVWLTR